MVLKDIAVSAFLSKSILIGMGQLIVRIYDASKT